MTTRLIQILLAAAFSGCALFPAPRSVDDVRNLVSAADVLVANVAPLCRAPAPKECAPLPIVMRGLDEVREAIDSGNVDAAIAAWQRIAPAIEQLAEVLR